MDSRQVYRGMDIGTGKDLDEYGEVPYHLIDIADPAREEYNLARFLPDAYRAIREIVERNHVPILCGGTALYLAALLDGYRLPGGALPPRCAGVPRVRQNPEAADSFTPPFGLDPLLIGVYYPRSEVHARIEARLDSRLSDGLVDEVRKLHEERGISFEKLEFFGLEYREVSRYLKGSARFWRCAISCCTGSDSSQSGRTSSSANWSARGTRSTGWRRGANRIPANWWRRSSARSRYRRRGAGCAKPSTGKSRAPDRETETEPTLHSTRRCRSVRRRNRFRR
ncbi:MAG: hypothetical protein L6W00_01420 [Lentisphaeria bacterium]|nr:MAG: hypothetical protein L6W00_01420 [Lentisphaeria bacterium]